VREVHEDELSFRDEAKTVAFLVEEVVTM